jgi:hypothetical protein
MIGHDVAMRIEGQLFALHLPQADSPEMMNQWLHRIALRSAI